MDNQNNPSKTIKELLQIEESIPVVDGEVITWKLPDGRLHRKNGPAYINKTSECWYLYGELHKEDGPAIVTKSGYKSWYINGKLHREDGPAVITRDGSKEYWINGNQLSHYDYVQYITRKRN